MKAIYTLILDMLAGAKYGQNNFFTGLNYESDQ